MNPQYAAAQLLYKIVGGVIPQSAKEQGMPVQAQHKQIALVSLHTFHDRLHFVPSTNLSSGLHLPAERLVVHGSEGLGSNRPSADVGARPSRDLRTDVPSGCRGEFCQSP